MSIQEKEVLQRYAVWQKAIGAREGKQQSHSSYCLSCGNCGTCSQCGYSFVPVLIDYNIKDCSSCGYSGCGGCGGPP